MFRLTAGMTTAALRLLPLAVDVAWSKRFMFLFSCILFCSPAVFSFTFCLYRAEGSRTLCSSHSGLFWRFFPPVAFPVSIGMHMRCNCYRSRSTWYEAVDFSSSSPAFFFFSRRLLFQHFVSIVLKALALCVLHVVDCFSVCFPCCCSGQYCDAHALTFSRKCHGTVVIGISPHVSAMARP